MLLRLLLTNAGFIAGAVIEGVLAVVALILIILVAKYGLPNFEKREPKPKREKPQPVTYALTYAAGGGTGESPAVEEYVKGAKITLKSNMFVTPNGKIFAGWNDGTKKYLAGTKFSMPAQSVTLTAQWVVPQEQKQNEPTTYVLKYVAGEGSGEAPTQERYEKGVKVILKTNMFVTPTGKQFDGWSDGAVKYDAKSTFTMPAQSVTLTAQWASIEEPKKEEPATYILRYAAGEGSGEAPTEERYEQGVKVILKTNMFVTPTGKQFDGWSDGAVKYDAKSTFTMPAQSVTLTAQWLSTVEEIKEQPVKQQAAEPVAIDVKLDGQQADQQIDGGTTADGRPIVVNVYNSKEKVVEKEVHTEVETNEGLEFADYTILELYGLLSDEQKRYFDTLKDAAMAKPQAKLAVGRSFMNIKIGKRSILKLRIRRLITVGEYSLENDILRDFRKASDNKEGNAKIKVRPTLVAVTDDATLTTALNMIDLVYKQVLES